MPSTTIDVSGQNNNVAAPYKGNGLNGAGEFLTGIAQAYLDEDVTYNEFIRKISDEDAELLGDVLADARDKLCTDEYKFCLQEEQLKCVEEYVVHIFREYEDTYLPQLYSRECAAGIYNNASSQLLACNAYADAVLRGGDFITRTVNAFNQTEVQGDQVNNQLWTNAMQASLNSNTQTDGEKHMERKPNADQFLVDAVIYLIIMGLLAPFLDDDDDTN